MWLSWFKRRVKLNRGVFSPTCLRKYYPLRRRYNTSYSLLLAPDGFYGNDAGNGTFNGVVGLVQVKFKFKCLFPVLYSIYSY